MWFDFDFRPLIAFLLIIGVLAGAAGLAVVQWLFSHVSISWS